MRKFKTNKLCASGIQPPGNWFPGTKKIGTTSNVMSLKIRLQIQINNGIHNNDFVEIDQMFKYLRFITLYFGL